ncbi:peptidoglycan-binding protein [Cellulomonas cellasea]|uniref:Peptidoglycan hydrolase-like protein with peptidoglycan-binding domain n=1 Tax=Cellulomonas cellasea TaxID=43670 RepID=A0A7W4UGE9_9CELL|nr:peptidoglycan-binding protein [Cellulomonas cellasea]MBB2923730.1 peptidoglycan hydrolase-like protein with peptidoglycan-binding domain [Cellulomonas cellasea]
MRARLLTPIVLTALLASAGGVAGAVLAAPTPTPSGLAAAEEPRTAPVQHQSFADERNVEVTFRVAPERTLVGHTGGTLTWSACAPGVPVASGQVLLRADERPVVALHTGVPLYRALQAGDRGADVEALQRELAALGHAVAANGTYGASTTRAVRKLFADAGVTRPDGTLQLAAVVWLPERTMTPSTCATPLGGTLGDGQAVATVAGALTGVTYPVPAGLREGPRDLTLFGVTVRQDQAAGEVTDPAFLAGVAATVDYAVAREGQDGQKPKATLALSEPVDALKVPPTALFDLRGTTACVQQGDEAVPVALVGSGLGASLVQPLAAGTELTEVALGGAVTHTTCGGGERGPG